jgi:hypothetical protein
VEPHLFLVNVANRADPELQAFLVRQAVEEVG